MSCSRASFGRNQIDITTSTQDEITTSTQFIDTNGTDPNP
jgi:hypothetical protein